MTIEHRQYANCNGLHTIMTECTVCGYSLDSVANTHLHFRGTPCGETLNQWLEERMDR